MKRYDFTIPPQVKPGRLLPLACRMLPDVPEYALREAFKKRDVKVNGQRAGMEAVAVAGAQVCLYTRDTENKAVSIPVVYQDDNVIIVVKPAGVSCEADAKGGRTLTQLLQLQENTPQEPLLCHRLDNPTEGLIVLARMPDVQQELQDAFREHLIHKTYTCIVRGTPAPAHAVLEHYLIKDAQNARVRVVPTPRTGAKQIVTEYTVEKAGDCARLRIDLHTGRTHQIRAHMAFIGHPLIGDDQYGDRELNKQLKARKLMLCASRLSFSLRGRLAYLNEKSFTCNPGF